MITIFQVNGKFYVTASNGLQEIHSSVVCSYEEANEEVNIIVKENYS
jgi:hypothetical protein